MIRKSVIKHSLNCHLVDCRSPNALILTDMLGGKTCL